MKKFTLYFLISMLVLAFAASVVVAAPTHPPSPPGYNCPYYGANGQTNLTDEQKEQIAVWQKQALASRKEVLQKQAEWGWITQDQADQQISWLEQQTANGAQFGMGCGLGIGRHGAGGMGGMRGPGMMGVTR